MKDSLSIWAISWILEAKSKGRRFPGGVRESWRILDPACHRPDSFHLRQLLTFLCSLRTTSCWRRDTGWRCSPVPSLSCRRNTPSRDRSCTLITLTTARRRTLGPNTWVSWRFLIFEAGSHNHYFDGLTCTNVIVKLNSLNQFDEVGFFGKVEYLTVQLLLVRVFSKTVRNIINTLFCRCDTRWWVVLCVWGPVYPRPLVHGRGQECQQYRHAVLGQLCEVWVRSPWVQPLLLSKIHLWIASICYFT